MNKFIITTMTGLLIVVVIAFIAKIPIFNIFSIIGAFVFGTVLAFLHQFDVKYEESLVIEPRAQIGRDNEVFVKWNTHGFARLTDVLTYAIFKPNVDEHPNYVDARQFLLYYRVFNLKNESLFGSDQNTMLKIKDIVEKSVIPSDLNRVRKVFARTSTLAV